MNAATARESAGLTLTDAAKRARIAPRFLARLEKRGGFSYTLASRLAALYRCPLDCFLDLTNDERKGQRTQVSGTVNTRFVLVASSGEVGATEGSHSPDNFFCSQKQTTV